MVGMDKMLNQHKKYKNTRKQIAINGSSNGGSGTYNGTGGDLHHFGYNNAT